MFDIGPFELGLIVVVVLVVVGPERLPSIAQKAGRWVGRARSFVGKVKRDIDVEMRQEELRKAIERDAGLDEIKQIIDERYEIEDDVVTTPVVKAIDGEPTDATDGGETVDDVNTTSESGASQQAMLEEQDFDDSNDYEISELTDHSDHGMEEGDPPLGANPFIDEDKSNDDKQEKE